MKKVVLNDERLNGGKLRYHYLLGKPFEHGKTDCYTIPQSLFKDNLNIQLSNIARPNDWWINDINLYVDNYIGEGFKALDVVHLPDLRPFDCMLIALPDGRAPEKTVSNHCAVYLGDGLVIHHRLGKLSEVKPYTGMLRNFTTHVLRHKDVPDLRCMDSKKIDIMEFILPHKREILMGALNDKPTTE